MRLTDVLCKKLKPSTKPQKVADGHGLYLEVNVFPWIGDKLIAGLSPPDLLAVLRKIESRGAMEIAHKVLQTCGQVFRYAVVTSRANRDIAVDLKGALAPVKKRHFAAITDPRRWGLY